MPNLISLDRENLEYLNVSQDMFLIAKQLYNYNPQKAEYILGYYLDYDNYSEMMTEALCVCFDTYVGKDTPDGLLHFYFSSPIIQDYYTLCARHANLSGVSYKKDIFYRKAVRAVEDSLYDTGTEIYAYMDYSLSANPTRAGRCGIAVTSEFYCIDYTPFVSAMIDIIEFYDITRKKLHEEIARLEQARRELTVVSGNKRRLRKGIKAA